MRKFRIPTKPSNPEHRGADQLPRGYMCGSLTVAAVGLAALAATALFGEKGGAPVDEMASSRQEVCAGSAASSMTLDQAMGLASRLTADMYAASQSSADGTPLREAPRVTALNGVVSVPSSSKPRRSPTSIDSPVMISPDAGADDLIGPEGVCGGWVAGRVKDARGYAEYVAFNVMPGSIVTVRPGDPLLDVQVHVTEIRHSGRDMGTEAVGSDPAGEVSYAVELGSRQGGGWFVPGKLTDTTRQQGLPGPADLRDSFWVQ